MANSAKSVNFTGSTAFCRSTHNAAQVALTQEVPTRTDSGQKRDREELGVIDGPSKHKYRQRAHSNPLSNHGIDVPQSPNDAPWAQCYAERYANGQKIEPTVADIGCGFGGLSIALAEALASDGDVVLGMELRKTVAQYVQDRITSLRQSRPGEFNNVACIRANAMRSLPNYFRKAQLRAMVFAFPDPHFKAQNHRRRLIQSHLLDEYAYVLRDGALLYTITDVQEVAEWNADAIEAHPLFQRVHEHDLSNDPVPHLMATETEEGRKVLRNNGNMWRAVARRLPNTHFFQLDQSTSAPV